MKSKPVVIITLKPGQLGNRVMLFANFIGNAIRNNYKVINPSFDEYAPYFEGTDRNLCLNYPVSSRTHTPAWWRGFVFFLWNRLVRILLRMKIQRGPGFQIISIGWNDQYDLASPEFSDILKHKKFTFIHGWGFRDDKATIQHHEVIKEYFKPVSMPEIKTYIDKARRSAQADLLIGIHVRRGDYKNFLGGRFYYEFPEYEKVMEKLLHVFAGQKVRFIVCSNEKVTFANKDLDYVAGPGHFVDDLYSLSLCDYIAGPPSTFTRWASYYGKVPLYTMYRSGQEIQKSDFADKEYTTIDSFNAHPLFS